MRHQNPTIDKALKEAEKKRSERTESPDRPSIIGGVLSAVFTMEKGMSKYSKLIAAILGNVIGMGVAVLFGWFATMGLATCVPDPANLPQELCTVAGYSQTQITAVLMGIIMTYLNAQFVYSAPKNTVK